jgi:hypothetical protein
MTLGLPVRLFVRLVGPVRPFRIPVYHRAYPTKSVTDTEVLIAHKIWTAEELERMTPGAIGRSCRSHRDQPRPLGDEFANTRYGVTATAARRTVRATPRFFADLDRQLPTERGPNGEPSTKDFQVLDLLRIVERFAVE